MAARPGLPHRLPPGRGPAQKMARFQLRRQLSWKAPPCPGLPPPHSRHLVPGAFSRTRRPRGWHVPPRPSGVLPAACQVWWRRRLDRSFTRARRRWLPQCLTPAPPAARDEPSPTPRREVFPAPPPSPSETGPSPRLTSTQATPPGVVTSIESNRVRGTPTSQPLMGLLMTSSRLLCSHPALSKN